MRCRYCGETVEPTGGKLRSKRIGFTCPASPDKKHLGCPDGTNCIHCGEPLEAIIGKLKCKKFGFTCYSSIDKKHKLM